MKVNEVLILFIGLATLTTGFVMADPGINATPETHGISTSTAIEVVGSFSSHTDFACSSVSGGGGLTTVPPLGAGVAMYESVYSEDTQSVGTGIVSYAKELDIDTSGQSRGQWNVEATKQISYYGINGGSVLSSEYIMINGAGNAMASANSLICPFAAAASPVIPQFCNRAEAGSTIDMTVANVRTSTTGRFIVTSGDAGVELNHALRVIPYAEGVPSVGIASAYMDVLIQEGRVGAPGLFERIEFHEETRARGAISLFDKVMHYESGMVR